MDTLVTDDEMPVGGIRDALSIQLNVVNEGVAGCITEEQRL